MKDDMISRQAAIDAIEFGITYAKAINKDTGDVKELFQDGNDELRKAVERVKQLPSAQPTLYGYDIKHLAFVASIMGKEGVSPEEAVTIFRDINRTVEFILEDMRDSVKKSFEQMLFPGGQEE